MLGAVAAFAVGFLFAAPAALAATEGPYGGVTCTDYASPNPTYPADGSHFKVCFTAGLNTQRRNAIPGAVSSLPVTPRDFIASKGAVYYYFKNRADHNAFMAGKFPGKTQFQNTTAVCAHTGYEALIIGQNIAVGIWDKCQIGGSEVNNPDLAKVTTHESGHAFDYSLAAHKNPLMGENRALAPSQSSGYRALRDYDLSNKLPSTVCPAFQGTPSPYEIQLTATAGAVCVGGTVQPPYSQNMVQSVAIDKAPYFTNQSNAARYQELFAEQFSILAGTKGGVSSPKQFHITDNIVDRFSCTKFVVNSYFQTLHPPGPGNPNPSAFGPGKLAFQGCQNQEGNLK